MIKICRNCDHQDTSHPNGFLCEVEGCRCPGWTKLVEGIVDKDGD